MNFNRKFLFYLTYFKSTLTISIAIAVAYTFISGLSAEKETTLGLATSFLKGWCTVGLLVAIGYKHYTHENEYYFYNNAGISKLNLFVITFSIYVFISILIHSICTIVNNIILN